MVMEWQQKAFFVFVAAVLYHWVPLYIQIFGVSEDVYSHEPGPCQYVPGIEGGAEDMQTLADGRTFISSGFAKVINRSSDIKGQILLFDFNKPHSRPVVLKLEGIDEEAFTPHGLGVYHNHKTGNITVFVVNHHPEEDRIEKFIYLEKTKTLLHNDTYYDSRLTEGNDVAPVNEDSFYFTNYLFNRQRYLNMAEMYMPMRWGAVFFWQKGHRPELVASRLKQPNGILLSHDQKLVYVAHEGYQELMIYDRHTDHTLSLRSALQMNTSVDNLNLNTDGTQLWIGSHAVFWKMHRQFMDPTYPAPSQVLRLDLGSDGVGVGHVKEIYANDGSVLRGSSVASFYRDNILIGTTLHKLLVCELMAMDEDPTDDAIKS